MDLILKIPAEDWILLLIGIAIPILASLIKTAWVFVSNYSQVTPLLGDWHTYHWTRANGYTLFRYEKWHISRGLFTSLNLQTSDSKEDALQYKGKISFESNHAVLTFTSKKHRQESWQYRANDPIPVPDGNTILKGLFLGQDFDRNIFAAMSIGLRKAVDEEDAMLLMKLLHYYSEEEVALRMKESLSDDEKTKVYELLTKNG